MFLEIDPDEIDDSQWWDIWNETEEAWEMANSIYDPPVIR